MIVNRHNPVYHSCLPQAPLSVGNGRFAFTADITGLQSLYQSQLQAQVPLCTMAEWGWHTAPSAEGRFYGPEDLRKNEYDSPKGRVSYAARPVEGDEAVYRWLRENPHRLNLGRIAFSYRGRELSPDRLSETVQELELYSGLLRSRFLLDGKLVEVETVCAQDTDTLGFHIKKSEGLPELRVQLSFPYGSPDISGSDWTGHERHSTEALESSAGYRRYRRQLDRDTYYVSVQGNFTGVRESLGEHCVELDFERELTLCVNFSRDTVRNRAWDSAQGSARDSVQGSAQYTAWDRTWDSAQDSARDSAQDSARDSTGHGTWNSVLDRVRAGIDSRQTDLSKPGRTGEQADFSKSGRAGELEDFSELRRDSAQTFAHFWSSCGMIDFSRARHKRAMELERREILSLYLLRIQSGGALLSQETGLTCNSWYGKAHLEMLPWHCAWALLWNQAERLEGIFAWYERILPAAQANARCNGYRGARWPKMVDAEGTDAPSHIAVFLIWQQPHIIYMLFMYLHVNAQQPKLCRQLRERYWPLIRETADFMQDFAVWNEERAVYELREPLIPAQETYEPDGCFNPCFELEYWHFALGLAADWAEELGYESEAAGWREVAARLCESPIRDGVYVACESHPDTYLHYAKDHPAMLGAYGMICSERIEAQLMEASLNKVRQSWDMDSLWGWDFAMMAMTAVRLGRPELALEALLQGSSKNYYAPSGNNFQLGKTDLPLYLPGNGSFLWALGMMAAGYGSCRDMPGFEKNGLWELEFEHISPMPL